MTAGMASTCCTTPRRAWPPWTLASCPLPAPAPPPVSPAACSLLGHTGLPWCRVSHSLPCQPTCWQQCALALLFGIWPSSALFATLPMPHPHIPSPRRSRPQAGLPAGRRRLQRGGRAQGCVCHLPGGAHAGVLVGLEACTWPGGLVWRATRPHVLGAMLPVDMQQDWLRAAQLVLAQTQTPSRCPAPPGCRATTATAALHAPTWCCPPPPTLRSERQLAVGLAAGWDRGLERAQTKEQDLIVLCPAAGLARLAWPVITWLGKS